MVDGKIGYGFKTIDIILRSYLYLRYNSPKTIPQICRYLDPKKYEKTPNFAHKILKEFAEQGLLKENGTTRNPSNNMLMFLYEPSEDFLKFILSLEIVNLHYAFFRNVILNSAIFSAIDPEPYSKEELEQIIKKFGGRK